MAEKVRRRVQVEDFEEVSFPELEVETKPALEEAAEPPVEEARYFIDLQWYDQLGISFNTVAQARLCPSCAAKLGTFVEERYPVIDPKTKRVTFENRRVPYAANPLSIVRDCCSRGRDYITAETPLLEAMFRVFLANGNQPMALSAVREHLLTYLPEMAALRSDYPTQLLERVIRGDRAYGLREHKLPVTA